MRLLRRRVSSKIMNESRRRSSNKFFHLSKSPLKFTTSNSGSSTCSTQDDNWEDDYFDKETTPRGGASTVPVPVICTHDADNDEDHDEECDVLSKSLSPRHYIHVENTLKETNKDRTRSLDVPLPALGNVIVDGVNGANKKKKKRTRSLREVFSKSSLSSTPDSPKKSSKGI